MSRRNPLESILTAVRKDLVGVRERITVLEAENSAWRGENETLRAENSAWRGENETLREQIRALEAELAAARGGPGKHSGNSSKPPSSDHPHAPQSGKRKEPSGRSRGGQPGHVGQTRELIAVEEVASVIPCFPTECAHCEQGRLEWDPAGPEPIREQVWELPPIQWEVKEYQLHARTCANCGQRTWGERPVGAPRGCLGFRAQAALGVVTGGAQVTRRTGLKLAKELLGLPLSLGTLSRVEASLTSALAGPYQEVVAAVAAAKVVNCDESPWRQPGLKPWLWTASTPEATLFRIADRRDAEAFAALLPANPDQVKGTDRYGVYTSRIPVEQHAVCWAHLLRDFLAWEQGGSVAGTIARWLLSETGRLFGHWHCYVSGGCDREALQERLASVQGAVQTALRWGAACEVPKFTGLCRNLLDRWEALWTFARVEGVEPTNNRAERALRQARVPSGRWRKVSLFSQSQRGREYVERMLTVKTTLRQRDGNLLEFLTEALRAGQTGAPPPSMFSASPG